MNIELYNSNLKCKFHVGDGNIKNATRVGHQTTHDVNGACKSTHSSNRVPWRLSIMCVYLLAQPNLLCNKCKLTCSEKL